MKRILSFDIGIKNLAFCDFTYAHSSFVIHDWQSIDISIPDKKYDLNTLTPQLLSKLSSLFSCVDIFDHIVIENQPALVNPVMKSIQMIIFTFFHMKRGDNIGAIHLVSACHKTKKLKTSWVFKDDHDVHNEWERLLEQKKPKYVFNKSMSIYLCRRILQNETLFPSENASFKTYFETHKKKDDLADSFLQGLAFIL